MSKDTLLHFPKSFLVTLKIDSEKTILFGNQPTLKDKKLKTIISRVNGTNAGSGAYPTSIVPNPAKTDPAGDTSVGVTVNNKVISAYTQVAYLTLIDENNNKIHERIPLYLLDPLRNGFDAPILLNTDKVDWTKSFVEIVPPKTNIIEAHEKGLEIPLLVIYEDK